MVACHFSAAQSQQAPAQAPGGAQQYAEFGDFQLRNGEVIREFRLGYRTLGKLNAERSNAVLWPTWLGGKTEDLLQFIGPGNVVDSNLYFVVLVDARLKQPMNESNIITPAKAATLLKGHCSLASIRQSRTSRRPKKPSR